eukprot:1021553-Pyramimonas_sp.AAC.1
MVAMLYPALRVMGYGLDWRFASVLVWGGLRGAVGLALGLQVALTEEYPARDRCAAPPPLPPFCPPAHALGLQMALTERFECNQPRHDPMWGPITGEKRAFS